MCLSCGCVLSGGSPTDDHDDDVNITLGDLTAAANAQGISLEQAAQNILASLAATQPAEPIEDAVLKALDVADAPKRFVLGVAYPVNKVDGHGEFMTANELERVAWDYARNHRRVGFFHADGTENHVDICESYIYRGPDWETTDIDGQAQVIKAGDWMLGGICDAPGFELVKTRKADGWSIDGIARRRRSKAPRR